MSQPASPNNNQPNQPSILEQAKQGQPEAVAALINRSLKPKGLEATAQRQGDCLHITLSSAQVPNPKPTTALIQRGMTILQAEGLRRVKVRSCRSDGTLSWEQEFTIAAEVPINGDVKAKETISNITSATRSQTTDVGPVVPQKPSQANQSQLQNQSHPNSAREANLSRIDGLVSNTDTVTQAADISGKIPEHISTNLPNTTEEIALSSGNYDDNLSANRDNAMTANIANPNIANISSELTVIHSSMDNVPEYEDIVVRFMADGDHSKGKKKIRCLTTLSELLEVINKSTFPFRGASQNPSWQYLLETIADCTFTDEQGDRVLRHMMILQPGHTWQPVNLRLVSKVYIEAAPENEQVSHNLHQGITVDLAQPAALGTGWRDSEVTITAAQRSVDELTEIPEASTDDTLEDFLNDFIPRVQDVRPRDASPKENQTNSENWQVAGSTTAEMNAIASVAANPSLEDSLADFLGDFSSEPDLEQPVKSRSQTEVAVRTVRSSQLQMESDDVFGNIWSDDAPINQVEQKLEQSITQAASGIETPAIPITNTSAPTTDDSLLEWEVEPISSVSLGSDIKQIESKDIAQIIASAIEAPITTPIITPITNSSPADVDADNTSIGWELPEETTAHDPVLEEILGANLDQIITPVSSVIPNVPSLSNSTQGNQFPNQNLPHDPLLQELSAPDSIVDLDLADLNVAINSDGALDSISSADASMTSDDLFGGFASHGADSMSSIINSLPIPEKTPFSNSINSSPIPDLIEPIIETVTEAIIHTEQTPESEIDLSGDLFDGWNEAPIKPSQATQKKKLVETSTQVPSAEINPATVNEVTPKVNNEINGDTNLIDRSTNSNSNLDGNLVATPLRQTKPSRKLGPVLANEIAEIMAHHQESITQSNTPPQQNNGDDNSLFDDFVFSIDLNSESLKWENKPSENSPIPTRLSISGLSDDITL